MSRLALAQLQVKEEADEAKRNDEGIAGDDQRSHATWEVKRLGRLGRLIWWIMKVRGYKACRALCMA